MNQKLRLKESVLIKYMSKIHYNLYNHGYQMKWLLVKLPPKHDVGCSSLLASNQKLAKIVNFLTMKCQFDDNNANYFLIVTIYSLLFRNIS